MAKQLSCSLTCISLINIGQMVIVGVIPHYYRSDGVSRGKIPHYLILRTVNAFEWICLELHGSELFSRWMIRSKQIGRASCRERVCMLV